MRTYYKELPIFFIQSFVYLFYLTDNKLYTELMRINCKNCEYILLKTNTYKLLIYLILLLLIILLRLLFASRAVTRVDKTN